MIIPTNKHSLLFILALNLAAHSCLGNVLFDFNTNAGGFTTGSLNRPKNEWTYGTAPVNPTGNSWFVNGNEEFAAATYLYSPYFLVNTEGLVTGTFIHRYSFEYQTTPTAQNWDGGVLQFRTFSDQTSWSDVTLLSGSAYNGVVTGDNVLNSTQAFTAESTGYDSRQYVQTSFTLGYSGARNFRANDFVQLRFLAAWDRVGVVEDPNWQISTLAVSNVRITAVPEPGVVMLSLVGAVCLLVRGRKLRSNRTAA